MFFGVVHVFYLNMSCFYNKKRDFLKWTDAPRGLVVENGLTHPTTPESKLDYSEELSFPVAFPRNNTLKKKNKNFRNL